MGIETGYAVVKMLNGYLYVRRCGGIAGGYSEEALQKLAVIAKEEQVNEIIVESTSVMGCLISCSCLC